jgi:hypothetical protein
VIALTEIPQLCSANFLTCEVWLSIPPLGGHLV